MCVSGSPEGSALLFSGDKGCPSGWVSLAATRGWSQPWDGAGGWLCPGSDIFQGHPRLSVAEAVWEADETLKAAARTRRAESPRLSHVRESQGPPGLSSPVLFPG